MDWFVGHLLGEYVFQPELLLATQRGGGAAAWLARAAHTAIWTACVFACTAVGGFDWRGGWHVYAVVAVLHFLAEAGVDRASERLRTPSVPRAISTMQSMAAEAPTEVSALVAAFGVCGTKAFSLSVHALLLWAAFEVVWR